MKRVTSPQIYPLLLLLAACGPEPRPKPTNCDDGAKQCSANTLQQCVDGAWTDSQACANVCDDALGCVDCHPGVNSCVGGDVVGCNADGTIGPTLTACGSDPCSGGVCQTACVIAAAHRSYVGCEFWPVDLDNALDVMGAPATGPGNPCQMWATPNGVTPKVSMGVKVCDDGQSPFYLSTCDFGDTCPAGYTCVPHDVCANNGEYSPFAIVVSNPDTAITAMVTLTGAAGASAQIAVPPRAVKTLVPNDLGFPDQSLDYTGIETKAYHLVSDRPIIAYQFNPLNNVGVFTNDGSLLIPASAYDTNYYVLTHKSLARRPLRQDWNGYLTVVADGKPTTVIVTPTAAVRAGAAVAAIPANMTTTFTLQPYQTLTLEAEGLGDLSGSRVQCTPACGVFAGHEAINLGSSPGSTPCCADHLEDMVFPASTWGNHYIVSMSAPRMTTAWDLVRIVAQKPNTSVMIYPTTPGCSGPLQPGQWCEVYTQNDLELVSTEPILVGHFLTSNGGLDADSGDPALSFSVPVEQYRKDYTLLVPAQYTANFFAITVPQGGTAMLDGIDVTNQLMPSYTNQFRIGRIPVTAGQHELICPQSCGVEAEGWSEAVSYLYAGGLNFEQIVLE